MSRKTPLVFAASFLSFVIPVALSADQAPGESTPAATALRISTAELRPMLAAQAQGGGRGGGAQGGGTQGGGTQGGGTQGGGTTGGQGTQGGQGQGQKPTPTPTRAEDDPYLFPDFDALLKLKKACKPGVKGRYTQPLGQGGRGGTTKDATGLLFPVRQGTTGGQTSKRILVEGEVHPCSAYWVIGAGGGLEIVFVPLTNGMVPYASGSVGLERSFGSTALALQPSFGFRIPFNPFALNVFVDYRVAFYEGASEGAFGAGGGIVIPLGR